MEIKQRFHVYLQILKFLTVLYSQILLIKVRKFMLIRAKLPKLPLNQFLNKYRTGKRAHTERTSRNRTKPVFRGQMIPYYFRA